MAKKQEKVKEDDKFLNKITIGDYAEVQCHQVDTLRAISFFDENNCTILAVVSNNNNTRTIFIRKNKNE